MYSRLVSASALPTALAVLVRGAKPASRRPAIRGRTCRPPTSQTHTRRTRHRGMHVQIHEPRQATFLRRTMNPEDIQ